MEQIINELLTERFSKDSLISIATSVDNIPYCRTVDAIYDNESFYVITHALSGKMQQIAKNPIVAIAGEWFTGHGNAFNLGYFGKRENKEIASKMRIAFSVWIDNGHNDFSDENTIILKIKLSNGILFANGSRYQF
jgi:hypothetical protein